MKSIIYFVGLFFLLCLFSCEFFNGESNDLLTPYQPLMEEVAFIGHKGAGDPPQYGYQNHFSNSFESIQYAITNTSGSEIDLQISADSTIWLFHDPEIKLCDSNYRNIALLTNQQIRDASKCNYSNELITLAELIEKLNAIGFTNKILSLDLKVLRNKEALNHFGSEDGLASLVVTLTSKLRNLKGFKILAEVPRKSYIPYFKKDDLFEVFLLSVGKEDFEETKAAGYSANIDFFKSNDFKRDKSKKLQLWVTNSIEDILKAIQLKADYIQSDNVAMEIFLEHSKTNELHAEEIIPKVKIINARKGIEYLKVEYFSLDTLSSSLIFQFQFKGTLGVDSTSLLVFSCKDINGKHLFWEGKSIVSQKTSYLQFINVKKLIQRGGQTLKVFVWNQSKAEMEFIQPSLIQWGFEDSESKD